MLSATAATVRVGINWVSLSIPTSIYGFVVKIGLSETLAFICGYVFGPIQGFMTGVLIIVVSDMFTLPGLWTPFIAAIIGLIGICGSLFHRFGVNLSSLSLGISATILTIVSELFQNIWFAWYMWAFYMPETPFLIVLSTSLVGGIQSTVAALINNVVFFTALAPRVISILKDWVVEDNV